jgi:hypothetical protein
MKSIYRLIHNTLYNEDDSQKVIDQTYKGSLEPFIKIYD